MKVIKKSALRILFEICVIFLAFPVFSSEKSSDFLAKAEPDSSVEEGSVSSSDSVVEETPASPSSENTSNVEKIKVTGSRIKRIDIEGPSPVTIITKEELEDSGYFDVSEFLQNTSLSNFGSTLIHNRSTLTLVDGARLVYDESASYIPTSAIERIEILRDGASALYGSDVVGGVINIITKKNVPTPTYSLKLVPTLYPFYKGGSRAEGSFVFGDKFAEGHFITALQFQYHNKIVRSDRKKWYNPLFLEAYSPYPSFKAGKSSIVDPNCPIKLKDPSRCKYDLNPYLLAQPNAYKLSNYNYMELPLTGEIRFYSQLFGFWNYSIEPNGLILDDLELPAGHQMSQGAGSAGTLQHLFGKNYEDLFTSDDLTQALFLDGLIGFKGYVSKTWDWDWSLKWSNIWGKRTIKDRFYKEDLTQALVSGAYDPFNPRKRDLSSVHRHDAVYKDHDQKLFSSLDFSGETGFWDIDMAVGLQAYYNRYKNTADPKVKAGKIFSLTPVETGLLKRHVIAGYMEAVKIFSKKWEFQLAGRVDRYSDFGWTANPKLAIRFQPDTDFLFRSSVGTSFEAPSLEVLYTPPTETFIGIYDTVACYNELKKKGLFNEIYRSEIGEGFDTEQAKDKLIRDFLIEQTDVVENENVSSAGKDIFKNLANRLGNQIYCRRTGFKGTAKGNRDLKETKALTASAGFHWQMHEDHSLTVDYWWNSLSGSPSNSFSKKAMDAELRYGREYTRKYGLEYERERAPPHQVKNPEMKPINIAGKKLSGVDLNWVSDFPNWIFYGGKFYMSNSFSYMIRSGVELFPGMGFVNNLGKFGLPKWRNFLSIGWKSQKHDFSLVLKSKAKVKKLYNQFESLPMGHIVDLFYQYHYNAKTTFKFGWYNLLFSDPVLDDSIKEGAKFNSRFFDVRGPYFFAELRRAL